MRFTTKENVIHSIRDSTLQTSTTGTADWYRTWGSFEDEECMDMIIDNSGNIFLAGNTIKYADTYFDMFLLKYNSTGDLIFNRTWGTADYEECFGIELDDFGNIYLAGSKESYGAGERDMCVVKYDNTGDYIWQCTWGLEYSDDSYAIALDSTSNIYIAGGTENSTGDSNVLLVKNPKSLVSNEIPGYEVNLLFIIIIVAFISIISKNTLSNRKLNKAR
ncbi:MAG: hypothetical protein ACFE9Z_03645 [Promethearchaeota archaeon]